MFVFNKQLLVLLILQEVFFTINFYLEMHLTNKSNIILYLKQFLLLLLIFMQKFAGNLLNELLIIEMLLKIHC